MRSSSTRPRSIAAAARPAPPIETSLSVACGQTYSYVCNERTCLASFEGPGEQDLSDVRGPTVEVVTIDDGPSVTVCVDGKNAKLVKASRGTSRATC